MKREEAHNLYEDNCFKSFTTMEALYAQIKALAENGAYQMCIYVDSNDQYFEVMAALRENGYDVEHYNGGNNGILEINFG